MANYLTIAILIFCYYSCTTSGDYVIEFEQVNNPNITFDPKTKELRVKEEIEIPFKLLYVKYNGDKKGINAAYDIKTLFFNFASNMRDEIEPRIGFFSAGNNDYLDASIKYEDNNRWCIWVGKRQDFEQRLQQHYSFEVYIGTKNNAITQQEIDMTLVNIFDNDPVITYNGPCSAKELEENVSTDCIFKVYDIDGIPGNNIIIDIVNNNNEKDYFEFGEAITVDSYNQNFTLKIKKELHYDQKSLHNFDVVAYDYGKNKGELTSCILKVQNVPHKPPMWEQQLVTKTFDEKTENTFKITAVDGDTGIRAEICYKLNFAPGKNYSDIMEVNKNTGSLKVNKIDRDMRQQETYQFETCAFKCKNVSSITCSSSIFIVNDVNDNLPIITINPILIEIPENKYITVPLTTFDVNDIDLGVHASYHVFLNQTPNSNINYSIAYDIIPRSGYQKASFILSVSNKTLLDYEDEDWQNTTIRIIAKETEFPDNYTIFDLTINLLNWNDEIPKFSKPGYNVSIKETIEKNAIIGNVVATDRDINDSVTHTIIGNFYGINIYENGTVYTTVDNAFDYDKQSVVILQIKATDNLKIVDTDVLNEAITQLTINVIDVNNKAPEIRMPKSPPNITENSVGNTLITDLIIGTDPDTSASLEFTIDWEKTYATKAGIEAKKFTYVNCFILTTILPDKENNRRVVGELKVNPDFKLQVDYEAYETIYLLIRIVDRAQEINDDYSEGTLTITIDDVNDNAPQFIGTTLNETRFVLEESEPTFVDKILAEDIDGPGFNKIHYRIEPVNNTLNGLIEIDPNTGVLQVMKGSIIDCDIPKRDSLDYKIILTDNNETHTTSGFIKINITDINNKKPTLGHFINEVKILENSTTGTYIGKINASDADRDKPHNVLEYILNSEKSPILQKLFYVNEMNGSIYVQLAPNTELDRDNGYPNHTIAIDILDNYRDPKNKIRNKLSTNLIVILLDVNDNAPEMPKPEDYKPEMEEHFLAGDSAELIIEAHDKDEPNTNNSFVSFEILSIKPGLNCNPQISDYENLLKIGGDDKKYGIIFAKKDLKGYYGLWHIHIRAFDHGVEPMESNQTYTLQINPFNFYAPEIIFPRIQTIRLSDKQQIGKPLLNINGTELREFEAFDPDGYNYGNVTFHLSSYDNTDADFFKMVQLTKTKSRLELSKKLPSDRSYYEINIIAIDGGGKNSVQIKDFNIYFIDMEGDPIFKKTIFITNFTETDLGLKENRTISEADDPKNHGITDSSKLFPIYYYIDNKTNPENASFFNLNKETRMLTLNKKLNRTAAESHTFSVIATNNVYNPPSNPNKNSILSVTVLINDVNDNPPVFDDKKYGSGITTNDYKLKEILRVHATDVDINDTTTYLINSTISTYGSNIEEIKNKIFALNNVTGSLTLTMVPKDNMKGYFEFTVKAVDAVGHYDVANVKIYIISEDNRIVFKCLGPISLIKEKQIILRNILQEIYKYDRCNIDGIEVINDSTKQALSDDNTNNNPVLIALKVHFIKNNEAIEASEIKKKSSDNLMLILKEEFRSKGVFLNDIDRMSIKDPEQNIDDLHVTLLVVVSVMLGVLCIILVVAYILKARSLNRLLKAYEPTEFGSRASNLNRIGAPTTNVFSVEGSNPVINNNININDDFETSSIASDGSDFVGINNDPNFIVNRDSKSSKNSSLHSNYENNISNHLVSQEDQDVYDNYKNTFGENHLVSQEDQDVYDNYKNTFNEKF